MEGGPDGDELVRVPEAARVLSVSRSKLYEMMAAGLVAYTKFGRCRRVPRNELTRLIRESTTAPAGWRRRPDVGRRLGCDGFCWRGRRAGERPFGREPS